MTITDPDTQRGLYGKYEVHKIKRVRDTSTGLVTHTENIDAGECFVLSAHDPYAVAALRAYAEACAGKYVSLATDLALVADRWEAEGQKPPSVAFADTCCGKCPFGTCYVDQMTGA